MILCAHEHFHVNSESPLSCFGWGFFFGGGGVVWCVFVVVGVGFCFGFLEGFLHSLLLCFQDLKKFKKKSRAFCLLAFGMIFFFSIILPVEEEMNVHLF